MKPLQLATIRVIKRWAIGVAVVAVIAATLMGSGYRAYVVRTGSMQPTFSPGDIVIDKPQTGMPAVGDVVTFKSSGPDAVITHRVQDVNGAEIKTKGDANRTADLAPISAAAIMGRTVSVIPRLGYLVVYLRQPAGAASVVTLLAMLILAWGLFFGEEATTDSSRVG